MDTNNVYSVSSLTSVIAENVNKLFPPIVWVKGELSNFTRSASGHIFFSIKDDKAILEAVLYYNTHSKKQEFNPLTGELYEDGPKASLAEGLTSGMEVLCAGKIKIYEAKGRHQLVVEHVEKIGLGALHERFQQSYKKLEKLGYFAPERKRHLPHLPRQIALITSPHGSVLHDFVKIAASRGVGTKIIVYPVLVQGDNAVPDIKQAIQKANANPKNELLVLIRGGGSFEDLSVFNDEGIATEVYSSRLPVLVGIGHEPNISILDNIADVRASTPSDAAHILWPSRASLLQRVTDSFQSLKKNIEARLFSFKEAIDVHESKLFLQKPDRRVQFLKNEIVLQEKHLSSLIHYSLLGHQNTFSKYAEQLDLFIEELWYEKKALFDARLLQIRKKAMWQYAQHKQHFEQLCVKLEKFTPRFTEKELALEAKKSRLALAQQKRMNTQAFSLEQLNLRLEAVNPFFPLTRGYALMRQENDSYISSSNSVLIGEKLYATFLDGELELVVVGKKNKKA